MKLETGILGGFPQENVNLDQSLDRRYSFKAVYSQRGMLGDPHCYADVKLHKETRL